MPIQHAPETLTIPTPRGDVSVIADFPPEPGPFPAIVLAPGQNYRMMRPALSRTAHRLVAEGVAVFRFDWLRAADDTKGPSEHLADELQDFEAVLTRVAADPRIDATRMAVGGKSLGSLVAWRILAAEQSLRGGLFITPICSRVKAGQPAPVDVSERNYPGIEKEERPLLFVAGDRDRHCPPLALYKLASAATGGNARVAVVSGDHMFEDSTLEGMDAEEIRAHNVEIAARVSAHFVCEVCEAWK